MDFGRVFPGPDRGVVHRPGGRRGPLSVAGVSVFDVKRSTQANRVEPMAGTDREKALDAALAQIERQFGKGAVMRLGERPNEPIEVIPTGSTALDVALG
ncbi:hypothetical protein ACFWUS_29730, partial [Streptomyces cyaneofuscatus]